MIYEKFGTRFLIILPFEFVLQSHKKIFFQFAAYLEQPNDAVLQEKLKKFEKFRKSMNYIKNSLQQRVSSCVDNLPRLFGILTDLSKSVRLRADRHEAAATKIIEEILSILQKNFRKVDVWTLLGLREFVNNVSLSLWFKYLLKFYFVYYMLQHKVEIEKLWYNLPAMEESWQKMHADVQKAEEICRSHNSPSLLTEKIQSELRKLGKV